MYDVPLCLRCRRPHRVCVCAAVTPIPSRTRVVFVQHPRESRVPMSTCRLAHLSLPNSELHVALGPEGNPRLEAIATAPDTMVLFPGPGATDVRDLAAPPATLLVVDGTWINARKVVQRSPLLSALPRVAFEPERPSTYRIRREPKPTFVSTIEAVAHILDHLEGAPGRFRPILGAFDQMVEQQLAFLAARSPATRRHAPPRPSPLARLVELGPRLVLVFAEAEPWADAGTPPTLYRWVARRLQGGEGVEGGTIEAWRSFVQPGDTLVSWGAFAGRLLGVECLDVKRIATNLLHRPLGGVERFAEELGAQLPGRSGDAARRVEALAWVLERWMER